MIGLPQDTILDQPGEYLTRLIQGNKLDALTLGKGKIHSIVYNLKEWSGDLKKYNIVKSQTATKGIYKDLLLSPTHEYQSVSICSTNKSSPGVFDHGNLQLN